MQTKTASLLRRCPIDHRGLSFFDLPGAVYPELVAAMADEHKWHFEHNNTETHMKFLGGNATQLVEWSRTLPFPQGSVHLDVGAGEGILSYLVARRGYHSIAVELCATILHGARVFQSEFNRPGASPHSSMDLWVADIYELPLKTASIDFVTIKEVLHHLDDLDGLMSELSRVLKPGGMVYIWEPFDVSVPLLRSYRLMRVRPAELALGIHHRYHTYWTYQRLFRRWLAEVSVEREFESTKLQHHLTRNRFTMGSIHASGRIKPYRPSARTPAARVQIQPGDFLREEFIPAGIETTVCRKELLDRLLGEEAGATRVRVAEAADTLNEVG
jgi:ubiquinone/menaquinone biosynthesis C-methylase UbiE